MSCNKFPKILSLFILYIFSVGSGDAQNFKIMPLGDSITQGYYGDDNYRRALWLKLKQVGVSVDFVGSLNRNYSGIPSHTDFDIDHEGHWGWRADQVLERIELWMTKNVPDIVLLHLGTNDIGGGQDIEATAKEIEEIIMILRKYNANVTVLLAQIIPLAHEAINERIKKFNKQLAILAESIRTEESPVILVNHFDGFDPGKDTYDGVHPNERGMIKMVNKWYDTLIDHLDLERK